MMEVWKDIKGFESLYQVSDKGHVKSLPRTIKRNHSVMTLRGRILIPQTSSNGYLFVSLSKDGIKTQQRIHRLVAEAFMPNGCGEVNHVDENKLNNSLSNLEWVSHKENINHGTAIARRVVNSDFSGSNNPMYGRKGKKNPRSKSVKQFSLDGSFIAEFECAAIAGKLLNINPSGICRCANGYLQSCGGYIWKR